MLRACEIAKSHKKSTLQPAYIMKALEMCGFGQIALQLESEAQNENSVSGEHKS